MNLSDSVLSVSQSTTNNTNYWYQVSPNSTFNNNSLYYSPDIFQGPCSNNKTPYPCFSSVLVPVRFVAVEDLENYADSVMYQTADVNDICSDQYFATKLNFDVNKTDACRIIFCNTSRTVDEWNERYGVLNEDNGFKRILLESYCKYCNYQNDTLRTMIWNAKTCPFISNICENQLLVSNSADQQSICTSSNGKSSCFSSFFPDLYKQNAYNCYCESYAKWGVRCDMFEIVDGKVYVDYIAFNIFYFVEMFIAFFVLLIPALLQLTIFKPIRKTFKAFNTWIRTLWTGSVEGALGYEDEQTYKPFAWFSIRHLKLSIIIIINVSLVLYTILRIAMHASQDPETYTVIDIFFTICYLSMCVSFFMISLLWTNIALADRRKGASDVLLFPLRIVLFIIVGFMACVAIAWAVAVGFKASSQVPSGAVLIVIIAIFMMIGIILLIFGAKIYRDLVKVRQKGNSFWSLRFTKFLFMADITFLLTDVFFLLAAIQKVTHVR